MAHQTTLEDHSEFARTHEKLCFKKHNLEQDHEFLKAINNDLGNKSSSYLSKRLLLSTFFPQIKPKNTSNKGKKVSPSSNNNTKAKSNDVVTSRSLDSTNDSLRQVIPILKGIIERGVFKSLAGSKQFEEILRKQGGHRKKQGVGYCNIKGRSMILLLPREQTHKMTFYQKITRAK